MNDVFLAINQRPQFYLDQSPFGVLDLSGRATGGALSIRPRKVTRIIANGTTEELLLPAPRLRSVTKERGRQEGQN